MVNLEAIQEEAQKGMQEVQKMVEMTGDLQYLNKQFTELGDRFERIFLEASKSAQ